MRKNFGAQPYLYPQPVLIISAYGEEDKPNAMTAAWGCISEMDQVTIILSADHKTTKNILGKKAFTVSMADAAHVTEADYLGVVSANDVPDKFAKAGFHAVRSGFVDAPLIEELPLALECKLISYDEETGVLVGKIVNVSADEKILDERGNITPAKLQAITLDAANNAYLVLGDKVGNAFNDGLEL